MIETLETIFNREREFVQNPETVDSVNRFFDSKNKFKALISHFNNGKTKCSQKSCKEPKSHARIPENFMRK